MSGLEDGGESTDGAVRPNTTFDVKTMKVAELKAELRRRGLKTTGKKSEMIERLQAAIFLDKEKDDGSEFEQDDSDDASDCESEVHNDGKVHQDGGKREAHSACTNAVPLPVLTFKDVEESMRAFSGDDEVNIRKWIEDFEDMSQMCQWSEVQKIVYAKRLLRGSARLFVGFENCSKTWRQLKAALELEFSPRASSRQVHNELSRRKKKPTETYQEYVYKMMEIASQVDMDIQSVLLYIISGIPDEETNKTILYEAKSIKELRSKLVAYENMKSNASGKQKINTSSAKKEHSKAADKDKRCFNCGDRGHKSQHCKDKDKGPRCFACSEFGHLASNCPKKGIRTSANSNFCQFRNTMSREKEYVAASEVKGNVDHMSSNCSTSDSTTGAKLNPTLKNLKINGTEISALIDTGSDLNLIKSTVYLELGAPNFNRIAMTLNGIGQGRVTTLGRFEPEIDVDGVRFRSLVHVVPDEALPVDLIIGRPLLDQATLVVNSKELKVVQLSDIEQTGGEIEENTPATEENREMFHLLNITVEDGLDVGIAKYAQTIEAMIQSYNPQSVKETNVRMKIILKDETPVYSRPRRLSISEKAEVNRQIEEWLQKGIVRPSSSDFASPIVLVKKKTGGTRICIDFRELNRKVIKDRYPLPIIEDQIDKLQGARVFTTLDLKNGFFHVPVDEQSIKYTSFVTPNGQYEFLKTPFGLCNSPAVFQRYINETFKDLISNDIVLSYMDDLIIPAKDEQEAIQRLGLVVARAEECGLEINWKKCQFLKKNIEYLGHEIGNNTVKPSSRKVAAVLKFPKPTTIKQVQSFLGLTGYFRKFIQNYATIARPLSNLLREGVKFQFEEEQKEAFVRLKTVLSDGPVLKLYRIGAETELHTDASKFGFGAVLLQRDDQDNAFHPVYYASSKTSQAEEKYTSYELEVLAIIKALRKFRPYLLGIHFKIVTDCKAFQMTMNKKDLCVRVARWALLLEEFDYKVEHRPGSSMRHVDALSRNPIPEVMLVKERHDGLIARLKRAQQEDPELSEIFNNQNQNATSSYVVKHGIIYKETDGESLLVVHKSMQVEVIKTAHSLGHFAVNKTEAILKREYWFKKMRPTIEKVIRNCVDCILAERKQGKLEGLLNPIDKGDVPLDTYHVDHLGPLPSTKKNYRHIFAVVDAFTKFTWLYPTKSTTGEEVIDRMKKQAATFGNPRRIISDRATAFTSHAFQDYCREESIECVHITTGVPRGNGQMERINRTLIPILTKLSAPKPEEWHKYVEVAQQYLNSTPSRSTRLSPFEVLIGCRMKLKDDPEIRELIEQESVALFSENRDIIREQAKENIQRIQSENRKNFNKRRKKANKYKVGDLVAIKRTQFGAGLKLYPKFLGPYSIVTVLRNDRYIVEKVGEHEGPRRTHASADHMKPWAKSEDCIESEEEAADDPATSGADVLQDGRGCGGEKSPESAATLTIPRGGARVRQTANGRESSAEEED